MLWLQYSVAIPQIQNLKCYADFSDKDNVKFERQLLNVVPCLPHILAIKLSTVDLHPNVPVFWNRTNAYRI